LARNGTKEPSNWDRCTSAGQEATGIKSTAGTFGVGEDDGHQPGAKVGDLDGEIPLPELVHPDHLPGAGAGAGGQLRGGREEAQQREAEERLASSRHRRRPASWQWLAESAAGLDTWTQEQVSSAVREKARGGQACGCRDPARPWPPIT